jgi:Domain of unknown function (DUF4398)
MKSAIAATVAGLGLCLLAGCKSTPAPTQQMTAAKASVRAAHELGAQNIPKAQLHLQLAEEQARHADELMEDGKNERASLLLQRADADAQLAIAITRQDAARDRLRQSMEVMEFTP